VELTRGRSRAIARALLVSGVALARSAASSAEGPATFGPNVSYYQVDASELGVFSTGNQYGNFGLLRYALNTGYRLAAPVHLPSGALVTSTNVSPANGQLQNVSAAGAFTYLPNLGFGGEHQIDVLLDLALDRIEGDDAGLADPGADVPRNLDPAAALGDDLESSLGGEHLPQAADLGDGLQFGD